MSDLEEKHIGICIARIQDETTGELVNDICVCAAEKNFKPVVFNSFYDFFNPGKTMDSSESIYDGIRGSSLCGLIIAVESIKRDALVNRLCETGLGAGIPVVTIDRRIEGCSSVMFDYSSAFEKIVRHIAEYHKCRKIFFLGGIKGNPFSEERLDIYKKVLAENNIEYLEKRVGYGNFWEMPAAEAVNKFLSDPGDLPEAIICANDVMAITACKVIEEHGLSVPDDIIVTGFDGIEQEKYHTPRLTTAYQDNRKAAEAAVDIIAEQLSAGVNAVRNVNIPYEIGISQSCGCQTVQYKNINYIVMDLYNKLNDKDNTIINMNSMTNKLTGCSSIKEALPKIESYIGVLYTDAIFICLRESLIFNTGEDLSVPIAPDETLILAVVCIGSRPELVMKPFRFNERLPYIQTISEPGHPILNIPLHYQEKVFGFMSICYEPGALQYDVLYNFSMSFNHSLDTLNNKEMMLKVNNMLTESNQRLENAFTHDSLTGLLNRRGFYKMIVEKYQQFPDGYIFVQSIDLDGLKYINDNFGHQEGDFAIKSVASAIRKCTGNSGICARFGGDEFMAVLFSADKTDSFSMSFSVRLDDEIRRLNKISGKPYPIAASSGSEISRISEDIDLDSLMRSADEKMYKVKSSRGKHLRGNTRH